MGVDGIMGKTDVALSVLNPTLVIFHLTEGSEPKSKPIAKKQEHLLRPAQLHNFHYGFQRLETQTNMHCIMERDQPMNGIAFTLLIVSITGGSQLLNVHIRIYAWKVDSH